jgi:hypothetical protein
MSRLEAFMVAIGMILLGMAAARAEPVKLPEIIRGTGPTLEQSLDAPMPAQAQADTCGTVVAYVPAIRERRSGSGMVAVRHGRPDARARHLDSAIVPAFNNGPLVPRFR